MNRDGELPLDNLDPEGKKTETGPTPTLLEPEQPGPDALATASTPADQTADATAADTATVNQPNWYSLPPETIAHIGSYLDLNELVYFQLVHRSSRDCVHAHLIRRDFWQNMLLTDFHIPLVVSDTFLFPHMVHERLTTLANHPCDHEFELFKKIRYAFCAPGYDPFSMPWLFFPFTGEFHDRFISQLNEDGVVFRAYYFDIACQVGNLAFVQFMIRKYGCKLNSEHLKYACRSGNLDLVKLLTENYRLKPSSTALTNAAISGNVSLVEYLTQKFKLQPNTHTLDCSLLSANCEVVKYLRNNYQIEHGVNALNFAITSGNTELLNSLPPDLTTDHIDSSLSNKTLSLELVQTLIEKKNFAPTQKTLDKALAGVHQDLIKFILTTTFERIPDFLIDFSHCCISGNIDFVKKIIEEQNQMPDLNWLLCAIFSGNVLLVNYLIRTYALDPKNIDLWRFKEPHIMMEPFVFCHVPMAKFLIEEHGCTPIQRRFEDYIRGKNLPLARYLITECGFRLKADWLQEMDPDSVFGRIWLDGGPFEQLLEMGRQLQIREYRYAALFTHFYRQQLSSNPLFRAFRMKESYRFEGLQPELDLSALGGTLISAMSLFIRQRMQHCTYLEIAAPCSFKRQNAITVLQKVAESVKQKFEQTGKPTKKILIPFSIDQNDREWHLLELTFELEPETRKKTFAATIYSTVDYLYCRNDDPTREFVHEWAYDNENQFTASTEEQVNEHFSSIFADVQNAFGRLTSKTYRQSVQSRSPNSSVFSLLMTMLENLQLINSYKMYKGERSSHRFNYNNGGTFLSTMATSHWRAEVLGFIFVNLNKIPALIQDGFGKTDDTSNLETNLSAAPKLITHSELEGTSLATNKNVDYFLFKEAFLETFEFDGYDITTQEFLPAFPEDPKRKYKFPTKALTFWTAVMIFFGIPSRPEKANLDEGAVWTLRQTIRNFFGGWNPVLYNEDTGEDNIEGKVLVNILLTIIPVKIALGLFKLVTIPLKTALNTIKLFTEFLPTIASKKTDQWNRTLYNLRLKKVRHAQGLLSVIFAYLIYGTLSFLNATVFIFLKTLELAFRTATSPEKSTRMAWAERKNPDFSTFIGVIAVLYSLFFTFVLWVIITAIAWNFVLPLLTTQFPVLAILATTIIQSPLIAPIAASIKATFLSLSIAAGDLSLSAVIHLIILISTPLILITCSKLSDAFSDLWARWIPKKSPSNLQELKIEKTDDSTPVSKNLDSSQDQSKEVLALVTIAAKGERSAAHNAVNLDAIEGRTDEAPTPLASSPQERLNHASATNANTHNLSH